MAVIRCTRAASPLDNYAGRNCSSEVAQNGVEDAVGRQESSSTWSGAQFGGEFADGPPGDELAAPSRLMERGQFVDGFGQIGQHRQGSGHIAKSCSSPR